MNFDFLTNPLPDEKVTFLKSGVIIDKRFIVEKMIGWGGMGNVYLARDITSERPKHFAIKETLFAAQEPLTADQALIVKALHKEAKIMMRLEHPSIPRVFDYFEWQRRFYLVMDHIDGQTLNDKLLEQLKTHGVPFEEGNVIEWAILICNIFDYLHHQEPPVIHRDIKPENFIITDRNELKMIDYGIARQVIGSLNLTSRQGTPGYFAPETLDNYADQRTDLYSLGVMMHVLLTAKDPRQVPHFSWEDHRPRQYCTSLSRELDDIIMRCLRFDMSERWPSAAQLRDALVLLRQTQRRFAPPVTTDPQRQTRSVPIKHTTTADIRQPLAPHCAWSFTAQGPIRSSPVLKDNVLYFGAHDAHLYAVSLRDGAQVGAFPVNGNVCSDPVVTDRSVFFGAEDGVMYALNRSLSRKHWTYTVGSPIVSTPILYDDMVVIGANDGVVYGFPVAGTEPRWRFETWGPVLGSLARIKDMIVFGSEDQRVYALDADGKRKWSRTTREKVEALPVIKQNAILIGSMDEYLYAFDYHQGNPLWKKRLDGGILTAVALHETRIYVGTTEGRLFCLDMRNGETKWQYNVNNQITSDLVMRDQWLYFGCKNGALYRFDTQHQEVYWRFQTNGPIVTRPLLVNGLIITGSMDHHLYALHDMVTPAEGEPEVVE
ncbi:MAG: PQQ-binding-like beta-propeller repeat protein [Ktedonobacterales bacterium]|nr:PQQ-binding-like beta-propeller repeat protein [Ktedonobacterales bacterium]